MNQFGNIFRTIRRFNMFERLVAHLLFSDQTKSYVLETYFNARPSLQHPFRMPRRNASSPMWPNMRSRSMDFIDWPFFIHDRGFAGRCSFKRPNIIVSLSTTLQTELPFSVSDLLNFTVVAVELRLAFTHRIIEDGNKINCGRWHVQNLL